MASIALPEIEEEVKIATSNGGGPWKVVLWDDDEHTYDYVIEMLMEVCQMTDLQAFEHAIEVDTKKKTIVFSGELEHAEFIQEKILGYGPDIRMSKSKGSMTATLER
ncbi:MAG: ATP-dependent Clp protease adaptor ClpS [Leptospiraceae bacterium]|nr:ATP-dependent Clp protease adaptor ClpS [Leptospiraceae bacterium]